MPDSFDLRKSFGEFLSDLNRTSGQKNMIKLSIDVRIHDRYRGPTERLLALIQKLVSFLGEVLVNGIIHIELAQHSKTQRIVNIAFRIEGKGNHLSTFDLSNVDQLIKGLDLPVRSVVQQQDIIFEFTYSFEAIDLYFEEKSSPFFNKRILVAEDNEINAMVFSSFLEEWGCVNTVVVNGAEAVHMAHEHEFDAILMDIFMPVLNGNIATRKIREFNPAVPIIALTASTNEEDLREAVGSGANDYLLKPVSSSHLYQVLSKYF